MSELPGASYTWRDTTADQFSSAGNILSTLDLISTLLLYLMGWNRLAGEPDPQAAPTLLPIQPTPSFFSSLRTSFPESFSFPLAPALPLALALALALVLGLPFALAFALALALTLVLALPFALAYALALALVLALTMALALVR